MTLPTLTENIAKVQALLNAQNAAHAASMTNRNALLAQQQMTQMPPVAAPGASPALVRAVGVQRGGGQPLKAPTGNVSQWINQALRILKLDSSYAPGIAHMIKRESGGNPNAINKWDSNWKKGIPSKGLMQTIDPTFNRWALPGYNKNVYDPVSNIIAGIRYAQNRYGDEMLKTGGRKNKAGKYIGY